MASGTVKFTTDATAWERIDDGAAYVAGEVQGLTSVRLCYMPATSAPASLAADSMTLDPGEKFSFEMGTGESLWMLSTTGTSSVIVIKRAV